jgi:hypothetical protein
MPEIKTEFLFTITEVSNLGNPPYGNRHEPHLPHLHGLSEGGAPDVRGVSRVVGRFLRLLMSRQHLLSQTRFCETKNRRLANKVRLPVMQRPRSWVL